MSLTSVGPTKFTAVHQALLSDICFILLAHYMLPLKLTLDVLVPPFERKTPFQSVQLEN